MTKSDFQKNHQTWNSLQWICWQFRKIDENCTTYIGESLLFSMIWNCTILAIVLSEFVLSGDPLYYLATLWSCSDHPLDDYHQHLLRFSLVSLHYRKWMGYIFVMIFCFKKGCQKNFRAGLYDHFYGDQFFFQLPHPTVLQSCKMVFKHPVNYLGW